MRARLALLLCVVAAGVAAQDAATFSPSASNYSVAYGNMTLGDGTITLAPEGDKDCYRYERRTHPIGLVRWTYGSPRETSLFCVRDGVIRASHFEYVNDKRAKDNFTIDFDWAARKARVVKGGQSHDVELAPVAYDRQALDQAVRLWARAHAAEERPQPQDFVMVEDDRVVTYKFAISGREAVKTPAGEFQALLVERIDNPNKKVRIWFAPARDFLPVKIENIKDGKLQLRMLLQ